MNILISNDDGVLAPGIEALSSAISCIADVDVIAPERNRSGASNSLTLLNPLRVRKLANGSHSVDGTPTDCVHLALTGYFDKKYDIVLSGVNDGANLGDDVLYSGTIAAAMEGCNLGLPAIAFSSVSHEVKHFESAAQIAKQIAMQVLHNQLPSRTMLNVNIPDLPVAEIKGFEITRLGTRHAAETTQKLKDPRGRDIFWIGQPGEEADAGPGTDFFAVKRGFVSITPIHLDMTNYKVFDTVSSWIDGIKLKP
ncbi:MAG: 5'/3'-nucleotidase SurE [Legionellales bacterium RIFCSPHIGHO2_12_FULL_35_11]|nr:MAG: 5'/3'-nucleotidase SurE [Legionellales bacterium RIFCSPHIGHO2_12_FULL_35_11]